MCLVQLALGASPKQLLESLFDRADLEVDALANVISDSVSCTISEQEFARDCKAPCELQMF
jgi:hypothetical protein